jgi:hypothetical protein
MAEFSASDVPTLAGCGSTTATIATYAWTGA